MEGRRQKSEISTQKAEGRSQQSEVRSQKPEVGSQQDCVQVCRSGSSSSGMVAASPATRYRPSIQFPRSSSLHCLLQNGLHAWMTGRTRQCAHTGRRIESVCPIRCLSDRSIVGRIRWHGRGGGGCYAVYCPVTSISTRYSDLRAVMNSVVPFGPAKARFAGGSGIAMEPI